MKTFIRRRTAGIFAIVSIIAAFLFLPTPTGAFVGSFGPFSLFRLPGRSTRPRDRIVGENTVGAARAHAGDNDNEESDDFRNDDDDYDESNGALNNLLKDTRDLVVGDWVVAKRDVPSLGIRAGAVYKIEAIFLKGADLQEGLGVETIPLLRYGDDAGMPSARYTKYLTVYNPRDHGKTDEQGVVVTPDEIGLTSVRADWTEAALLAVPGFFWVFVAMAFSNYYTDRYGGSFLDAFFRT